MLLRLIELPLYMGLTYAIEKLLDFSVCRISDRINALDNLGYIIGNLYAIDCNMTIFFHFKYGSSCDIFVTCRTSQ